MPVNMLPESEKSVLVVGAGLIGAVQALLFAQAGYRVTVLEKHQLRQPQVNKDAMSSRTVALSHRSWQLLCGAGLWPTINCGRIQSVHVTEQGRFGSVKLHASKLNVEALGYVMPNAAYEYFLHQKLKQEPNIEVIESVTLHGVESTEHSAQVSFTHADETTLRSASLVIAADGTQSAVREMLNVKTRHRDYQQCAVLANVATRGTRSRDFKNTAFERFTADGPLALLPLHNTDEAGQGDFYSMIYTAPATEATRLQEMPDREFLNLLQTRFGGRLGRFTNISQRYVAALALTESADQVKGRVVLMGNAMRTLHPVAGQGMNLALRDAFELVSSVVDGTSSSENTHTDDDQLGHALQKFVHNRRRDQWLVTKQTDTLARMFIGKPGLLRLPRTLLTGSGLFLLDVIEPLKNTFANANMGRLAPLPVIRSDSLDR